MSDTILVALVGGICGVLSGIIAARYTFKAQIPIAKAQAERSNVEDALQLKREMKADLDQIRAELDTEREERRKETAELREEIKKRDEIIEYQNIGIGILTTQLVESDIVPAWKPNKAEAVPSKHKSAKRDRGSDSA